MSASKSQDRSYAEAVKGVPPNFLARIREAVSADPQLPRQHPTQSQWQHPPHPTMATIQSESLQEFTDFVVIGSGITGCSVTKALLEKAQARNETIHVTVLEARTLVSGATGRNGGHLVTPAGHSYSDLLQRFGKENADQIVRFSIMNIDRVMDMVRQMDPNLQSYSEIRDVRKVMATSDEETWKQARKSLEAFREAIPEYKTYHEVVEGEDVPERWNLKNTYGAIEHDAGAVWPYRLLTGVFEHLMHQYTGQLSIETNTPVTNVHLIPPTSEVSQHPYAVHTPRGIIHARHVIYCTNAHTAHLLPKLRGKIYPFRGTMSVQKAGPSLKNVGDSRSWSLAGKMTLDPSSTMLHTGLLYLQQNPHTSDVWVGTETSHLFDILTSDDTYVSSEAKQALREFLPTYFQEGWGPQDIPEIKAIWTGLMAYTSDGLPLVGQLPECITDRAGGEGEWIAGAYNGYGMDKAWLTGEALVSIILGEGVPSWFPKCFLVNERRFLEDMSTDRIIQKFASLVPTDARTYTPPTKAHL